MLTSLMNPCSWILVLVLKYFMQSLGKAHSCLWVSHGQEIRLFLLLHLFMCPWELKGNSDPNGFFGDVLSLWSGVKGQLMATPARTPVK